MPEGKQPGSSRWARRKCAVRAPTEKPSARMKTSTSTRCRGAGVNHPSRLLRRLKILVPPSLLIPWGKNQNIGNLSGKEGRFSPAASQKDNLRVLGKTCFHAPFTAV